MPSIIAISGLPMTMSISALTRLLSKTTKEAFQEFQVLNFSQPRRKQKTAYVRLSDNLNPESVVETMNMKYKAINYNTYIPKNMPKVLVTKRKLNQCSEPSLKHILPLTHREIINEMQTKFCGLYNLSKKTGHKLLTEIAVILFTRLKKITSLNREAARSCIVLSRVYRKQFPHCDDFEFIVSTLHALQDAAGAPRALVGEEQLSAVQHHPFIYKHLPFVQVENGCRKYSKDVARQVMKHIKDLETTKKETDTEEEAARVEIRSGLKKLAPFVGSILRPEASKHFIPVKPLTHEIWMYGEPFLPEINALTRLLKTFKVVDACPSQFIYNLVKFHVFSHSYNNLMSLNGTKLGGAKLVIRSGMAPRYKVPLSVLEECLEDVVTARQFFNLVEDEYLEENNWVD